MEQSFQLYTWQNPDRDITKESRDSSKGPLTWGDLWPKLQPLYKKLEEMVGTLDFVWCFPAYKHWGDDVILNLWVLDVPSPKILRVLNDKVWQTIRQDADNNRQTEQTIWDSLILEKREGIKRLSAGNNDNITPLVRVPLYTSIQVIDKSKFNKGIWYINAKYEDLPTSECEAKRCQNEGPKKKVKAQRRKGRNSLKRKRLDESAIDG